MALRSLARTWQSMIWRWRLLTSPPRQASFRVAGSDEPVEARLRELADRAAPLWTITTYERPQSCARLVTALGDCARKADVRPVMLVVRDAGESDYGEVAEALAREFGERGVLVEATHHLGKPGFWELHQQLMDAVRWLEPTCHLSLQDDLELVDGWYDEMWSIVESIDDPELAVLYLLAMDDDEPDGRWIYFDRVTSPDGRSRLTRWLDLQAYLALPRMYEVLDHRMLRVHPRRWKRNPTRSSGVGLQLTSRLFLSRANAYQVVKTLVYHGGHVSRMNPEQRAERPLDNRPKCGSGHSSSA